ncbi:MAG: hypothetical protein LC722_07990 [Actinobacteria bacterium]|nr:hypothetical protein [Actinomycetota bacterium]
MLADTEQHPGRWVLVPSKDERFLGPRARSYARARDRRRAVFMVMMEALGITTLIGLVPPLRLMWVGTAVIGSALLAYCALLLKYKAAYEAEIQTAPRRAIPVHAEPEILENDLRILRRQRETAAARRAIMEPAFEMPSNVRVYAAR